MQLTGNTVLITGATSGIGRALAENFHMLGNKVIILGRRQALLDSITAANPGMRGFQLDMQDSAAVLAFAKKMQTEFPDLNVLINNAGIANFEVITDPAYDIAGSRAMIQTNIVSVIELTAALLPALQKRPSSAVITTTSGLAFVPAAAFPTYSATKAFLHSWLQSIRYQLRNTSVKILELAPPYVQTELGGTAQAADPNAMPLADFIAEVMSLLAKPELPNDEILVERVKFLRNAESTGQYPQVFGMLSQAFTPHSS